MLVKAAIIHYQFETIHPFLDGNGRIARMLLSFCLMLTNIIPFPIILSSGHSKPRKHYLQAIINRQDKNKDNDLYYLVKINILRTWRNFNTFCGNI